MAEEKKGNDQQKRSVLRGHLVLASIAVLLLLPCLGLGGSVAYLKAWRAGVLSRWRSLGTVPDSGVEIVTADRGVVYVRTAAGEIYGCGHGDRRVAETCWIETEEPLEVDRNAEFDKRLFLREVEPPSGTVVDALEVTLWRGGEAFETRYVLLEDRSVWKWEYDQGVYRSLLILTPGPIAGAALAAVLVVVMWVRARSQGARTRVDGEASPDEGE